MKWRLRRKRRPMTKCTGDDGAGTRARREAEANLDKTRAHWPEVHEVAQSLRDLRERNHFAEQILHIFEGGPRP